MSVEEKSCPSSPRGSQKTAIVPATAHLPRRSKHEHSNGGTFPRRRRKRCARNTSLPTIVEDEAPVSPTRTSSTTTDSSLGTSSGDMQVSNGQCRAVISMRERRPTRGRITGSPRPNNAPPANRTNQEAEEKLVSGRRPYLIYDLLPPACKNPSYMLRADLDIPRSRFILTHRTCYKRFGVLPAADKAELVRAALDFAATFELSDCVLIVPLGSNNKCDTLYNTFYAYIHIPKVADFVKVFERLKGQIPLWPSVRWITPFWDIDPNDTSVERNFLRTVRGYHKQWSDVETPLTEFKGCIAKSGKRFSFYNATSTPVELATYDTVVCEKTGRVGFLFEDSAFEKNPVNRWRFLDLMFRRVKNYVADQRRGCYMLLSLAERFLMGHGYKTYSILHFEDGIPDALNFKETVENNSS